MSAVSIIGVHDGHNSAAARMDDGKFTGAVQEERFTRAKNQGDVPHHSIEWLLRSADGKPEYLAVNGKYMVYGEWSRDVVLSLFEASEGVVTRIKQHLKSTPIDHLYLSRKEGERFSAFDRTFLDATPNHVAVEHHLAHASAAYFGSGWCDSEPVLLLTCDGTGDRLSGTVSIGQNGEITRIAGIDENDSLGQIYAVVTYIMGMLPLEHEYKVMGLAPYVQGGQGRKDLFEGILEFDKSGLTWRRKGGIPPLFASTEFFRERLKRARFDHISSSLQSFAEEMLTTWARNCVRHTGVRRVACSGGVFMNVKANQAILDLPEVEQLFIFPSGGDESNSMGAAYWVYEGLRRKNSALPPASKLGSMHLGPAISDSDVETALRDLPVDGFRVEFPPNIEDKVAESLASGRVVARAKGAMEFGARALGNRSILARPDSPNVVRVINDMIKCRDFWMPFAPSVLKERGSDYYVKSKPMDAPFMIITFNSRPEAREKFPAAMHPYDHTTRPQEVDKAAAPDYYWLLKRYEEITGEGIVLNTSFNIHGEPIVATAADAISVLVRSGLQYLAVGNAWIEKLS